MSARAEADAGRRVGRGQEKDAGRRRGDGVHRQPHRPVEIQREGAAVLDADQHRIERIARQRETGRALPVAQKQRISRLSTSSAPLPTNTWSGSRPCRRATASRNRALRGSGYSRSEAPSAPISRRSASATRGLGGYGFSLVLSLIQPGFARLEARRVGLQRRHVGQRQLPDVGFRVAGFGHENGPVGGRGVADRPQAGLLPAADLQRTAVGVELLHVGEGGDHRRRTAHAGAAVATRLVRRMKSTTRRPLKKRPLRPVGSTWLGPAMKSPSTVGRVVADHDGAGGCDAGARASRRRARATSSSRCSGRDIVGHVGRLVERPDLDRQEAVGEHAADRPGAGEAGELRPAGGGDRRRDDRRRGGHQRRSSPGPSRARPGPAGRRRRKSGRAVPSAMTISSLGPGRPATPDGAEDLAHGLADPGVARAEDLVHRRDGRRAVGHRADAIDAADAVDLGDPAQVEGGEKPRGHAALAVARREDGDFRHARRSSPG